MNDDFTTAMGRALESTRAGDLMKATRLIQSALNADKAQDAPGIDHRRHGASRRRPLGQTIDSLVNGRQIGARTQVNRGCKVDVPPGARFDSHVHAGNHGICDYRLFVPSGGTSRIEGLIMMLHGCTQTAEDFALGTRMNDHAERENVIVIYPQQKRAANQMGCWNWFRPEDQAAGRGEPALLADLAQSVATDYDVAAGRIFVAGLSAGGAMAAILGATHPQVFAAAGVHSGLAPGAAWDVASAFSAMRGQGVATRAAASTQTRSIVFHGEADATVAPSNADAVVAAALAGHAVDTVQDNSIPGAVCTFHRDAVGRSLIEEWRLAGVPHAWSGGHPDGSYTCPAGPDASAEMMRFFLSTSPASAT